MKKVAKLLLLTLFCICLAAGLTSCKKNYELSFETNGGSAIETIKAEEGKEIELPVPVRESFEFQGWFENESFSGSAVEKVTPTEKNGFAYTFLLSMRTAELFQQRLFPSRRAKFFRNF